MIKPNARVLAYCVKCADPMRFSCQETEASGFIHDVFECTQCRSTQSYVAPILDSRVSPVGERRSRHDRRSRDKSIMIPSDQQLSLFVRRVRRAMQDAKSQHLFCIQSDQDQARGYPDVLRVLEWIEEASTRR